MISGGEEDVANLALRLAISQMIAERAGQPLSLLVLDEIFGSLDEDAARGGAGAAPEPRRPLPAGHPDHPHRLGARRLRPRSSGSIVRRAPRGVGAGRGTSPLGGQRCGGLTGACTGPTGPRCATSSRSTGSSPRRSPTATPRRPHRRAGAAASIRPSGATPSRTPARARCSGATPTASWSRSTWCTVGGPEGWMGPLAVRPDRQGGGLGQDDRAGGHRLAAGAGRHHHRARDHAAHDGQHRLLQPARLRARGTSPSPWCATPCAAGRARRSASRAGAPARSSECAALAHRVAPGTDFTARCSLTLELARWATRPLVREGRGAVGVRPLALGAARGRPPARRAARAQARRARPATRSSALVEGLQADAVGERLRRVAIRCQTAQRRRLPAPRRARLPRALDRPAHDAADPRRGAPAGEGWCCRTGRSESAAWARPGARSSRTSSSTPTASRTCTHPLSRAARGT